MSLHLTTLALSHFRSYQRAELQVDARPVAIWGPNGAGKTNLIEAISLLSPGRGMRRASAQDMTRRPEALGWKVSALLHGQSGPREVTIRSEAGAARVTEIDGKPAPQVALGRVARVLWLIPSMDRLWIEAPEGRRRFLDRMTLSFFPDHAEASLTYEKAMRERNRLLKEQVRDTHWYAALERQMAQSGAAIQDARQASIDRLAQAQQGAETRFPAADLEMISTESDIPSSEGDLREALAEGRFRDMAAGRTLVGRIAPIFTACFPPRAWPASECSTGEQKALLISLILANARALAAGGDAPILLLDEVAAHLDAQRRAALYDEICALGAQAWMTGTGPELFTELGSRAQQLEVRDTHGQSFVEKATD